MRFPTGHLVRPVVDDHVDRPEVYAQQCVQPTGTNRPRAWKHLRSCSLWNAHRGAITETGDCSQLSTVSGGHSGGVTPVPIPNTEVKPASADGTWGESPWESRTSPEYS